MRMKCNALGKQVKEIYYAIDSCESPGEVEKINIHKLQCRRIFSLSLSKDLVCMPVDVTCDLLQSCVTVLSE